MPTGWQIAKHGLLPLVPLHQDVSIDIPEPILNWLYNRGCSEAHKIEQLQRSSLKNLTSPFQIKDMNAAASRIAEAFFKEESICIYGDFDMDGTPAVALLLKGLRDLGYENVDYYQPSRLSEGYGLHIEAIKKIKASGCTLLVTVDLGITAVEAAQYAKSVGLDLVITDHHLPGEILPEALAIVNPNQKNCQSNMGYLAGTGVAFYLLLAVATVLKKSGVVVSGFSIKKYLDLFALGTIADMVPLREDNHALVKHGLHQMQLTENIGLRELLKSLDLWGRSLKSSDIAMKLAPSLNALSRLEIETRPIEILLCENQKLAEKLAEEAKTTNALRKKFQNEAYEFAKKTLINWPHSEFIYLSSPNFHKGIIGLVATKLVQDFRVPTFIGYQNQDHIVGSARVPDGDGDFDLTQALLFASENLSKFGGHKVAAGFELKKDQEEKFILNLEKYFSNLPKLELAGEGKSFVQFYDADLEIQDIDLHFMNTLEKFEPFGQDFAAPLFRILNVEVLGVRALSGGHLKLVCKGKKGTRDLEALWFSPPKTELVKNIKPGFHLDMLVQLQWNHYNGTKTIQLVITDLMLTTGSTSALLL